MQPWIVGRKIAGLAHHFFGLRLAAIAERDPPADGAAVALRSFQAHLQPVVARRSIVAQQRRRLILVHDQHVQVSVVVEVAKGTTTADVPSRNSCAGFFAQLDNFPFPWLRKTMRGPRLGYLG